MEERKIESIHLHFHLYLVHLLPSLSLSLSFPLSLPLSLSPSLHSSSSDVWAFGVVLYEIWTRGALPYAKWPDRRVRDGGAKWLCFFNLYKENERIEKKMNIIFFVADFSFVHIIDSLIQFYLFIFFFTFLAVFSFFHLFSFPSLSLLISFILFPLFSPLEYLPSFSCPISRLGGSGGQGWVPPAARGLPAPNLCVRLGDRETERERERK